MKKLFFKGVIISITLMLVVSCLPVSAAETEDITEATTDSAGVSEAEANSATEEETTKVEESGMLIEIGNTTAEETTIIIRTEDDGETVDQTVQISTDTNIVTDGNSSADLSDWIAGDQITYTAEVGDNSGELKALKLRNRSFKRNHRGKNGWIKAIDADAKTIDVEWASQIFTLDVSEARIVAGLKNPASIEDFEVGDRIRARVTDDGDYDASTWDAKIVVVLRRGSVLFMRVTRWVVPAEIVSIPEDTTVPYVITAKVLPSKFYQEGDVNNLIGAPGTELTIEVNENTILVRRFLGRATIGEFMEGDKIRVVGRLNDGTGNLDANLIKNNFIQAFGVSNHISEVISVDVDSNTLIVKPIGTKNPFTRKRRRILNAEDWTLILNDETVIKEEGEDISLDNVEAGDIVRVRGVRNNIQKTVLVRGIAVVTELFENILEN